MEELFAEFVKTLKKRYGNYDEEHHRFDKSSNSEIARELGYSDAQFSRLINGSATEGEYQRANQNLGRIVLIDSLNEKLENYKDGSHESSIKKRYLIPSGILFLICIYLSYLAFFSKGEEEVYQPMSDRETTLTWAFETSYVKPYINLDNLPEDCDYPCYKYQGKWSLNKPYKIPFFREQNGYHYMATEVTMYARCMSEIDSTGRKFEGYEYQKHEIWYDKRELPVDSFINTTGNLKVSYQTLDFRQDENFVRVANVHTFFRNEFEIVHNSILRTGKVIGRDLEVVDDNDLAQNLDNKLLNKIKSDINRIASNRLEDFSKPIACEPSQAPSADFNRIKDGDIMSFACRLTTSRVAFDYTKKYILQDQYIKNTCRPSE